MIRMILLLSMLTALTACSEFAVLMSGGSFAASQNSYVKLYNGIDMGVVLTTKKGIKQHAYEKGKKYIVDYAKAKALGITSNH